jgi:hypothetical protein
MNRLVTLGRIRESVSGQMPKMIWDLLNSTLRNADIGHQDRAMGILDKFYCHHKVTPCLITALMAVGKVVV